MHRRGVQCLQAAVPNLSRAYASAATASASALEPAAAQTRRPPRKQKPPRTRESQPQKSYRRPQVKAQDECRVIRSGYLDVVKQAARGPRPTWSENRDVPEEQALRAKVLAAKAAAIPMRSLEKRAFFTTPSEEAHDQAVLTKVPLNPGTFVELRRNLTYMHGVILEGATGTLMKQARKIFVSTGEVWETMDSDIMFTVPDFIQPSIITRCGAHEDAENEQEINARVTVLKRLKELELSVEREYSRVLDRSSTALRYLADRAPDEWAKVTVSEVAKTLLSNRVDPVVTLLCVHKVLMDQSSVYVADPMSYLTTQAFSVRPLRLQQDLRRAGQMLARHDPVVQSFVDKARVLITASRARPRTKAPEISVVPNESVLFNEHEQIIVRLLVDFIRSSRSTQKSPYVVLVSTLFKKIDMIHGVRVDQESVHQLLIEMGVLPPWDNPVVRDSRTREAAEFTRSLLPSPSGTLAEDEFAPDIVESLRHDFGNLPIYVIDDFGARELDDGVSIEAVPTEPDSHWVHVHIADPTSILHPNHSFSKHAALALQTHYYTHSSDPMIPIDFAQQGLSLGSGKDGVAKVMTFSFKTDPNGDIVDYRVRPAVVRNINILRYDDVDAAMGVPQSATFPFGRMGESHTAQQLSPAQREDIQKLQEVADRLTQRRRKAGVIQFALPQARTTPTYATPPPTELATVVPNIYSGFPSMQYMVERLDRADTGARHIISECAKAACRVASRFFRDRGVPAIRRVASPLVADTASDLDRLRAMRNENCFVSFFDVIKLDGTLPKSDYSLQTKAHWQLGVPEGEGYVRVTSPLRRYGDMVAHWNIKAALLAERNGGKPYVFSEQWLTHFAQDMIVREGQIDSGQQMDQRYWQLRFIERWMATTSKRQKAETLGSLVAYPIMPINEDIVWNRWNARAAVPQLGLITTMVFPSKDVPCEIGEPYPVKITRLRFGLNPTMEVTLAKS